MAKEIKKEIAAVNKISKQIKTKQVTSRLDCKGRTNVFCKDSGIAKIKVEMPDGSTHDLMEINTAAGDDNFSRINVRVKVSPVSNDKATIV